MYKVKNNSFDILRKLYLLNNKNKYPTLPDTLKRLYSPSKRFKPHERKSINCTPKCVTSVLNPLKRLYSKGTDLFLYDYFFNKKNNKNLKLNYKGEFIWQI